jgi:osomolarity two-component system sensor histidine kinase TcsA
MRDGKWEGETWYYRSDGSRYWASITLRPNYQLHEHVGFVKLVRDDTKRKTTEARMIAALDESSKMKSEFLANMSHEIRNLANGMHLSLSLLAGTTLNSQQQEYAVIMQDSMSIILQVINNEVDRLIMKSGKVSLTLEILSVRTLSKQWSAIVSY